MSIFISYPISIRGTRIILRAEGCLSYIFFILTHLPCSHIYGMKMAISREMLSYLTTTFYENQFKMADV